MTSQEYRELALRYAPVFAQKVSIEWRPADQIAPVDVLGGIADVADNPQELNRIEREEDEETYVIPAKIYYSVCETSTHYFLIYAVYHIIDWWKRGRPFDPINLFRDLLDEHIHDMEGALLVITKQPRRLVDGVVTVAHNNFYLYTEPMTPRGINNAQHAFPHSSLRIAKFNETVDGHIWLDKSTRRVNLYIQSRGHGTYGDHKRWGGGDQIWYYYPAGEENKPGTLDKNEKGNTKTVAYELVDIFAPGGLWEHRFNKNVFLQKKSGKWGFVYKRKGRLEGGSANPPWSWNDHNDISPVGEIASDPARFITRYAQGWGPVSTHYIHNPYQSILGLTEPGEREQLSLAMD